MALDRLNDLYANDASDTAVLRHYLRQYTYIDYTADDWLDKLLYALPLHGMNQQEYLNADDEKNNFVATSRLPWKTTKHARFKSQAHINCFITVFTRVLLFVFLARILILCRCVLPFCVINEYVCMYVKSFEYFVKIFG